MKYRIQYEGSDNIIVVRVQTPTKAKLEELKSNQSDQKRLRSISTFLFEKYGIDLTPNKQYEPERNSMYDF